MTLQIKQIRKIKKDLLLLLEKKEAEVFGISGLNRYHLPVFAKYGRLFVIYKDNNPVGLAELMQNWDDSQTTYLVGFSIFSESQGQGIGKEFLNGIIDILKSENIKKIELTVDPDNEKALNLYQEVGFRKSKFSKEEYGPKQDRFIMELIIKE